MNSGTEEQEQKRRQHAQERGQRISPELMLAGQDRAGLFRAEPAAKNANDENDTGQQQ